MRCGQTEIFKREEGVKKVKAFKNIGKQKPISFAHTLWYRWTKNREREGLSSIFLIKLNVYDKRDWSKMKSVKYIEDLAKIPFYTSFPAGIYLLKVIETPWQGVNLFKNNNKDTISHFVLVFLLNFEHIIANWVLSKTKKRKFLSYVSKEIYFSNIEEIFKQFEKMEGNTLTFYSLIFY